MNKYLHSLSLLYNLLLKNYFYHYYEKINVKKKIKMFYFPLI